jgi:2-amino-4-hydroxy-6-hydroxymethyldihydropteridine diphosphokinase
MRKFSENGGAQTVRSAAFFIREPPLLAKKDATPEAERISLVPMANGRCNYFTKNEQSALLVTLFLVDSRAVHPQTMSVPETAYLSLGSNLGDRAANLRAAVAELQCAGRLLAVSALYETQPVEVPDQPWFLNCVAAIETAKSPGELLSLALHIEATMGRVRMREKGPRTIDIDIVLFGNRTIDEPGLKIPHPALPQRRFVLEPLVEIAPEACHPLTGQSAREMLSALPEGQRVRRL